MTVRTAFNEYDRLARVVVKSGRAAFKSQSEIDDNWQRLKYREAPNFFKACLEHQHFTNALTAKGVEVLSVDEDDTVSLDSIYMRDSSLVTPNGVILCSMGKGSRAHEPAAARAWYVRNDIRILGAIDAPGTIEGGDVVWFDEQTLAVAEGYRTNPNGISQLRALLPGVEIIPVALPHWNGPADVLHLMSFISPIDKDLAVIYPRMMPVPFMNWLRDRDIKFIEVPDEEYDSMACNVLALAPRDALMIEGNPITEGRLWDAGVQVQTYEGLHISKPGAGGPTCLTRPLARIG